MIKFSKQLIIIVAFLPLLGACQVFQFASEENYRKALDADVGKPIQDVVDQLGQADQLSEAPNGNKLFIYSFTKTTSSPVNCKQSTNGASDCVGGETNTSWCKVFYEVDKSNVVVDYSLKGNGCRICTDTLICF
ncbi:MAG: hypothetical protein NUV63_07930 [Gallionella sp.]|nr:hypothetical protein [Gallionella sp.]